MSFSKDKWKKAPSANIKQNKKNTLNCLISLIISSQIRNNTLIIT